MSKTRWALWFALLVVAIGGEGCGEGPASESPAPEAPSPPSAAVVTVIDAGQEPRRTLRYAAVDGSVYDGFLSVGLKVTNPRVQESSAGVAKVRADVEVDPAVPDDPQAGYAILTYDTETDLPDGVSEETRSLAMRAATFVEALRVAVDFDDRRLGYRLERRRDLPDASREADPQLLMVVGISQFLLGGVPFPAEPVGLGALWESHREITVEGIRMTETARFRVSEAGSEQLRVSIHVRQTAAPQVLIVGDEEIDLRSHHSDATGFVLVSLSAPIAHEAYATSEAMTAIASEGRAEQGGIRAVQGGLFRVMASRATPPEPQAPPAS